MSQLNYSLLVPSTVEPVSRSLAKKQLRVDIADDDELIDFYIGVARDHCERKTNIAFYPQTYQLVLDVFPYGDYRSTIPLDQRDPFNLSTYWTDLAIRLPRPMCLQVNSITYRDEAGTAHVLDPSNYFVDVNSRPARLVPKAGTPWPTAQFYLPGSIVIEYVAASFAVNITETIAVSPAQGTSQPFIGRLMNQVLSIASVKDTAGTTLTYTPSLVTDQNGDPTSTTALSFATAPIGNVAVVSYQAGFIPKTIVMAILLIIAHLYENREETTELNLKTLPLGVDNFLKHHKFESFGNYQSGY